MGCAVGGAAAAQPGMIGAAYRAEGQLLGQGARHDAVHRGTLIGAASADDRLRYVFRRYLSGTADWNRRLARGAVVFVSVRAGASAWRSAGTARDRTNVLGYFHAAAGG